MQFRIQDILKNILPGLFLLLIIAFSGWSTNILIFPMKVPESMKDLSAIILIVFLAINYVFGYFIDAIASLTEKYLLYKCFSKPSFKLLNNESKNYNLDQRDNILQILCSEQGITTPNIIDKKIAISLFKTANVLKDKNPSDVIKEKVAEYYNGYIFSRNLMVTIFIGLIYNIVIVCCNFKIIANSFIVLSFLLVLTILSIIRWRSKAFYYSRQVFYASQFS